MNNNDTSGFLTNDKIENYSTDIKYELIYNSQYGYNAIYKTVRQLKTIIIKALKPEFIGNPIYELLLQKEYDLVANLNHPNICSFFGFEKFDLIGSAIVMEYIDGLTLDKFIDNNELNELKIDRIATQICSALTHAHDKQIIHRDLKPQNILITANGENVKIIDFGFSDSDSHVAFKQPAGTLKYASPEQINGETLDNRSDIYALGIVLNELCRGKPNRKYRNIIDKCCQKNREDRYQNCKQIEDKINKKTSYKFIAIAASLIAILAAGLVIYINSSNINVASGFSKESIAMLVNGKCYPQFKIIEEDFTLDYSNVLTAQIPENYYDASADSLKFCEECYKIMEPEIESLDIDKKYLKAAKDYTKEYIAISAHSLIEGSRKKYSYEFYIGAQFLFTTTNDSLTDSLRQAIEAPHYFEGGNSQEIEKKNKDLKNQFDYSIAAKWIKISRERTGLNLPICYDVYGSDIDKTIDICQ
ncbi:MAG: serine/threonine-protein kinase [Rikenellaceae bacterium]